MASSKGKAARGPSDGGGANEEGVLSARFMMFSLSGGIGNLFFLLLYTNLHFRVLWELPEEYRPATSWAIAYFVSIWLQHLLHRKLVFGEAGNYWTSLAWTYGGYTLAWALSTVMNYVLTTHMRVEHKLAWFITMGSTGVLNYFTISHAFLPERDAKQS